MRRIVLFACLFAVPVSADTTLKTAPIPLDEVWEAAYIDGDTGGNVKIGHIHLTSTLVDRDGARLLKTTKQLRFVLGRGDSKAEMSADMATIEDAAGKVHGIEAKIGLGKDRTQVLNCAVEGEKIVVTADGEFKYRREFRWDPTCIGLASEQTLLRDKKVKPGDEVTYRYFEPQVANYVRVRMVVKDKQMIDVPGSVRRELLHAVATPDPLMLADGRKLQLPAGHFYVDPTNYDTIKTVMEVPELGKVTLVRTSKIAALAPNGNVPDLMKRQSIYLPNAVPEMHRKAGLTYRIKFAGDVQPKELLSQDSRQTIANVGANAFDLQVTSRRVPAKDVKPVKIGDEFLKSNYFLNSTDADVRRLANQAIGASTDPWQMAQKIESFVLNYMRPANYTEAMAPADHVARTRSGDCTEYSMLAAAMCRAVGVPSRTAIGLVYVDSLNGRPALAFHMWFEVFVQGQWLSLDATLGMGSIGPGHIKITDHSWDGVLSFTPLLPVKGFIMASPSIEVVGK